MSLTVQQLLSDARRLSTRLRDHDATADDVITNAQVALKEVEAMQEYQEDLDQLNSLAQNRPRAQLVLGIQQENRHIRQLQHENKELRAALEESQNALELIMSKYRQHMSYLVHTTKIDKNLLNHQKSMLLQQKTEQIHEMAGIMQKSIQLDEEGDAREQEIQTRLVIENKGLREMLEISRSNGSLHNPLVGPRLVSRECQTDPLLLEHQPEDGSTTPTKDTVSNSSSSIDLVPAEVSTRVDDLSFVRPESSNSSYTTSSCSPTSVIHVVNALSTEDVGSLNGLADDLSDSEDDEVTFNTIKRSSSDSSKVNGGVKNTSNNSNGGVAFALTNGDNNGRNSNGDSEQSLVEAGPAQARRSEERDVLQADLTMVTSPT